MVTDEIRPMWDNMYVALTAKQAARPLAAKRRTGPTDQHVEE